MANLVTLSDYKNYKNVKSDNLDSQISSIIPAVSQLIKNYCGLTFIDYYSTDKTEYFDGTKFSTVYLTETPLVSVTSVKVSEDGGVTQTTGVLDEDYHVDYENSAIISATGLSFAPTNVQPFRSLEVVYKGGYDRVPDDIKIAALDLIEYYIKNDHVHKRSLAGATKENTPFTRVLDVSLPPHIKRILEMHRVL